MFGKKPIPRNALLLHGTGDGPDSHWIPWLKNHLAWRGYDVTTPQLPQPDAPDMDRYWEQVLCDYPYNEQTVIVGHGSGAVAAFGILDRMPASIHPRLVISVAGFYKDEGWNCEGLFRNELNWTKIRTQAQKIELWWSNDDPVVNEAQTNGLAKRLDVKPEIFGGYGHFSKDVALIQELAEEILT